MSGQRDALCLQWLEDCHTLHREVEITYVVDGYQVEVVMDTGASVAGPWFGLTLADALDTARQEFEP